MTILEVIKATQEERGISVAELSRRTKIEYQSLWLSLNGGRRITALEFVRLCRELKLDIDDFPDESEESEDET